MGNKVFRIKISMTGLLVEIKISKTVTQRQSGMLGQDHIPGNPLNIMGTVGIGIIPIKITSEQGETVPYVLGKGAACAPHSDTVFDQFGRIHQHLSTETYSEGPSKKIDPSRNMSGPIMIGLSMPELGDPQPSPEVQRVE